MRSSPLCWRLSFPCATGTPGLISPDTNNFAPRIGLAYQATNKLVIRTGYGIFYGGGEAGPYSHPSMGVKPPLFFNKKINQPFCTPSAKPGKEDCSFSGVPTQTS